VDFSTSLVLVPVFSQQTKTVMIIIYSLNEICLTEMFLVLVLVN